MRPHMRFQIKVEAKFAPALVTLKFAFARMDQHVPIQFRIVQKALPTPFIGTIEQFFSMDHHMFVVGGSISESFLAGDQRTEVLFGGLVSSILLHHRLFKITTLCMFIKDCKVRFDNIRNLVVSKINSLAFT